MHMATAPSHAANLTSFSLYIKLQKEGVPDSNLGYGNTHSHREHKPIIVASIPFRPKHLQNPILLGMLIDVKVLKIGNSQVHM